jgi:ferredoxin
MTMTEHNSSSRTVFVDPEKCTGSTICMAWAPHSFEVGPNLKTIAINPFTDSEAAILRAIEECPRRAISFADGL